MLFLAFLFWRKEKVGERLSLSCVSISKLNERPSKGKNSS